MTLIQSQKWSRRLTIAIWAAVIIFGVYFITQIIIPKTPAPIDNAKVIQTLEDLKESQSNLINAETRKDSSYQELKASIESKNAKIESKINKVNNDLNNVRNEKKIDAISHYTNADLLREYADREREYLSHR